MERIWCLMEHVRSMREELMISWGFWEWGMLWTILMPCPDPLHVTPTSFSQLPWVWLLKFTIMLLPGKNVLKDWCPQHGGDCSCPSPKCQGDYVFPPGELAGWYALGCASRWANSVEPFMLPRSQWDQTEARLQLKPHLCLASAPALSVSLTSFQISPESTSSINHLHKNSC